MPRKKKEETAEEVNTTRSRKKTEDKPVTTTCSKYGFAELQNKAKLQVPGLHGKVN